MYWRIVAGKSISSSQRSIPLAVVSLLDVPDHRNILPYAALGEVIAVSANLESF
jgi:hypothetical protein